MQLSVSAIITSVSLIVSSRKEYNQVLMKTICLLREKYYRRDLCAWRGHSYQKHLSYFPFLADDRGPLLFFSLTFLSFHPSTPISLLLFTFKINFCCRRQYRPSAMSICVCQLNSTTLSATHFLPYYQVTFFLVATCVSCFLSYHIWEGYSYIFSH